MDENTLYVYRVIREELMTGQRGKRAKGIAALRLIWS